MDLGIEGEAKKVKDIKFNHEELPFYLWDGTRNDSGSTQESVQTFDSDTFWKEYKRKIDQMKKRDNKSMSIDQNQ